MINAIVIAVTIMVLFLLVFALQHLFDEINSLRNLVWRIGDEMNLVRKVLKMPAHSPGFDELDNVLNQLLQKAKEFKDE